MLFGDLTLSNADDVSQLLAFLGARDFLGCALRTCILHLDLVEDRAPPGIPWSHHLLLRLSGQALLVNATWTIRNSPADDELQQARRPSSLPSWCLLPRTLPTSSIPLFHLTLSGLHIPSVRGLANFIKHLQVKQLQLEKITFLEANPGYVLHPRSSPRTSQSDFHVCILDCIKQSTDLPFWIKLAHTLLASQLRLPLDDDTETMIMKHLQLFASLHQCEENISTLAVNYMHLGSDNLTVSFVSLFKLSRHGSIENDASTVLRILPVQNWGKRGQVCRSMRPGNRSC
ncbi:uncharacterized protein PHACADRAFT_149790 [Phanerochaete carnosa HHB-10118-sp]|uniref:Uncharacterized protein n=1 Tax=Phanerochaete carnosa (strain HHB-10118-sp) TaxID=650164 RepID=K5W1A0_PHACS|nr:uncharacterized protein PHACADRAFT_149790 [Phanerochaete carnosa HHB-10118-sp]EKM52860.1 hypothetical protein PHACADRAFT_149790 [Phanerochaete carnosa HHB-10118-sp]